MVGMWVARLLVRLLSGLSMAGVGRTARVVGTLAYALGIRRKVTLDNLRAAFPERPEAELRRIARGAYINMARAFLEGLAAAGWSAEQVAASVVIPDPEPLFSAQAQHKGVLIVTGHFGSWELMGEAMARKGVPVHCVVRPLKGALNAELVAARVRHGIRLIPPRGALRGMVHALRKGAVVTTLIDQAMPPDQGVFVPFFGRLASTNPSLSWAALRSGAPVLVVMGVHEGDRIRLVMEGPRSRCPRETATRSSPRTPPR